MCLLTEASSAGKLNRIDEHVLVVGRKSCQITSLSISKPSSAKSRAAPDLKAVLYMVFATGMCFRVFQTPPRTACDRPYQEDLLSLLKPPMLNSGSSTGLLHDLRIATATVSAANDCVVRNGGR